MKGIWGEIYTDTDCFAGDDLNEEVEKNVEAAIKEYAENAQVFISKEPGVLIVDLWCEYQNTVAEIKVDIDQEVTAFVRELEDLNDRDGDKNDQLKIAACWADKLEILANMLRKA